MSGPSQQAVLEETEGIAGTEMVRPISGTIAPNSSPEQKTNMPGYNSSTGAAELDQKSLYIQKLTKGLDKRMVEMRAEWDEDEYSLGSCSVSSGNSVSSLSSLSDYDDDDTNQFHDEGKDNPLKRKHND